MLSLTFRQIMDTAMGKNFRALTINFLLDQCFFDVGSLTFHQIIGIPMGSTCFFSHMNLNGCWILRRVTYRKQENSPIHFALNMFMLETIDLSLKILKRNIPIRISIKKDNTAYLKASFLD